MNSSILKGLILRKVMEDEFLRKVDGRNVAQWAGTLMVGETPLVQYVFAEEWVVWTDLGLLIRRMEHLQRVTYSEILKYEFDKIDYLSLLAKKKASCCLRLGLRDGSLVALELRSVNAIGLLWSLLDFVVMKNGNADG